MNTRKNCILFFVFLLLFCAQIQAQEKAALIKGKIYYDVEHYWDSTTSDQIFREVGILFFGEKDALYRSYDRYVSEKYLNRNVNEIASQGVVSTRQANGSRDLYYSDLAVTKLTRVRPFRGGNQFEVTYAMKEDIVPVKWQIMNETRMMGGYSCQKALGTIKGRIYTAWFCSDLPYNFGPWKLQGLPGLILEASDARNSLSFRLKKVELMNGAIEYIETIKNMVSTTEVAFETMRKAYYENPNAFSNGAIGKLVYTGAAKPVKKAVFNNPMDLVTKAPAMPYNY